MTLMEAGDGLLAIIESAQKILAAHLPPDGVSEVDTINDLLGLLDGPQWRRARDAWNLAKTQKSTRI